MNTAKSSTFEPFRNPRYLIYWLTGLIANFGWLIQIVAASWLMVSLGGTADLVALIQTALALPIVLFSLPAGAIADAIGRRQMVLISQAFLLLVSIVLAVYAYLNILTPWSLLVFTFLIGSGKALNNPGWQTMVNELVPRQQLSSAIALNSVGFNLARSVGPAIGGLIVASIGAFAAFVVNALANACVIITASRWPRSTEERILPPERFGSAVLAGIRYIKMSPHLLLVLIRAAAFNFCAVALMALMPLVAHDIGGGPKTYGFLLGGFGIGAICGALLGVRMRTTLSLEVVVRVSALLFATATIVISLCTNLAIILPATAIAGAGWLILQTTFNTTVQSSSPRWVVSRCHAILKTTTFGFNGLGSLVWGLVAHETSITTAIFYSGIAVFISTGIGLFWKLQSIDISKLALKSNWKVPEFKIDMLPISGPIKARITHNIAEEDVPTFLNLMLERRRYRIRDGASAWTLSRDIKDASLWYETFQTPTWVEMQRLHHRRTEISADIASKLRKLHRGEEKPSVQYELIRRPGSIDQDAKSINRFCCNG